MQVYTLWVMTILRFRPEYHRYTIPINVGEFPNCKQDMIWSGDHDYEDADGRKYVASNHHCNDCGTIIEYGQPLDLDTNE